MKAEEAIRILKLMTKQGDAIKAAIEALEKQIPQKARLVEVSNIRGGKVLIAKCPECYYSLGEVYPEAGMEVVSQRLPKFGHGDGLDNVGRCNACGKAILWDEVTG